MRNREGYLENYLRRIEPQKPGISTSIISTINSIVPSYIENFSYQEHVTGLLMGEVQSGKTAQMFGILGAAADLGFKLFILLTTDNIYLQQQTFKRALADLEEEFNICDETDAERFIQGRLKRPILLILKKNAKVLSAWRDNLTSSGYCNTNPLFIFDDEADAASLNTKVNKRQQSTINHQLTSIKMLANSSIYLQVTATPQSVILQSQQSGWKPGFVHYFPPGKGYLGGNFFYSEPKSFATRINADNELDELLDGVGLTEGLEKALLAFLITGAHIFSYKLNKVCNFLVHPSVKINHHGSIAEKIKAYISQIPTFRFDDSWLTKLEIAWLDLQSTKPDLVSFPKVKEFIRTVNLSVKIMNSEQEIANYDEGMNIIVGGNSLGRGVTFPVLQTIYYCRSAKRPQADTFWQHCRMFGYDRDPNLMRLFLPQHLLYLFTELNNANQMIIEQICKTSIEKISLLYPQKVNPTRKNVLDKENLSIITGGTSYFPREPREDNASELDYLLAANLDGEYRINYQQAARILECCEADDSSFWGSSVFVDCLKSLECVDSDCKVDLFVRRGRKITKGTGTLLSPNDRALGDQIRNTTVLTMYRLDGEISQKWSGSPFWIPNIKFPHDKNFHLVIE